ncbi:aminoglycoside phosphotransferase family protein [Marinicella sediminis]|uniref:Aminoglycoside phosphotransferase family protein n=1 Tax=Marinicella sediminis TaxID=1792834 RepID=A0ABV7J5N0_9GAMM|nr:phosphotransferase [Marinicella sediminis]
MSRSEQLSQWLNHVLETNDFRVETASEDASFRQYFRVKCGDLSYIAMDAPPQLEDCRPFVKVQAILQQHQVHVPLIKAHDEVMGFMLLTDFGHQLYLDLLNESNYHAMYAMAIDELVILQSAPVDAIPAYDRPLLSTELNLFSEWFIGHHLNHQLTEQQQLIVQQLHELLIDNALAQPQVFVHRDFHSRNLMWTDDKPGVIDFQDAVCGPVTYDLVSLLKDCYIRLPEPTVDDLISYYLQQSGLAHKPAFSRTQFVRWFDLMGLQRHLKAIGIFSRLNYRDGKPGYLKDIPRTMSYVQDVCDCYPELSALKQLLKEMLPTIRHPA